MAGTHGSIALSESGGTTGRLRLINIRRQDNEVAGLYLDPNLGNNNAMEFDIQPLRTDQPRQHILSKSG